MELTIISPLDMHLHLREAEMLDFVLPLTSSYFAGAVIMPNLQQPVDSKDRLTHYRERIVNQCKDHNFEPYMTLFFKPYPANFLDEIKEQIIGIKLYPAGITTQSEQGVGELKEARDTFTIMEDLNIPLLVHGESHGYVLDREEEFLQTYLWLAENFPKLHIIMEHITTRAAVEFLDKYDNISATVTLHHLLLSLDDVIGGLMKPHLFCKPVAKSPRDRDALKQVVFSGHEKVMFGSDSAPHPIHAKECAGCAAGIFTAPLALPALATLFEQEGCLEKLQLFVSDHAVNRYQLQPIKKNIQLVRKPFVIPEKYGTITPFLAGKTLPWSYA